MTKAKLSTRLIIAFILVLGIIGIFFLKNNFHSPAEITSWLSNFGNSMVAKNISISMDKQGLVPFDVLEIEGKNFDPDAATSVIFTSREKQVVTVPALMVSPTSVSVAVPPFGYNKETGKFNLDVVSFRVVQMKKNGTKIAVATSNEIAGIQVLAPAIPSVLKLADAKNMPVGTISRAFVVVAINSLKDAADQTPASSTQLVASLNKTQRGMTDLLSALDKYIKNPKTVIKIPVASGGTANLDAAGIAWLDAFYSGFLGLAEERELLANNKKSFSLIQAAEAAGTVCQINQQTGQSASVILNKQVNCLAAKNRPNQPLVDNRSLYERLDFGNGMWIIAGNLTIALLTCGASLEIQIASAIAFSIIADYLKTGKLFDVDSPPSIWSPVTGGYLDTYLDVPIADYLSNSSDVIEEMCKDKPQTEFCKDSKTFFSVPKKATLYIENALLGPLVDALNIPNYESPVGFNGVGVVNVDYDVVKPKLTPKTNPTPTTPTPIVTIPVPNPSPNPRPSPSPAPKPTPNPVTCDQLRQTRYNQCLADCGPEPKIDTYNACLTGCDSVHDLIAKSNCSNTCIGNWSKIKSDRSKCFVVCLDAYNKAQCP